MNKEIFTSFFSSREKLNSETCAQLAALLKEFPYCQSAQLLYAKNLHSIKDIHYGKQLKTAAIYASDRRVLYRMIMQPALMQKIETIELTNSQIPETAKINNEGKNSGQENIKPELQKRSERTPLEKTETISFLEQEILKEALAASYSLEESEKKIKKEEKKAEKIKEAPIQKDKMTFSQWMMALKQPKEEHHKPATPKTSIDEMLEKLSKADSKITSGKDFFSPANMGRMSLVDDDKFVTETLAKIYEQQGNYAKAISAYKNLSLKYPEKSAYFATRISSLEMFIKK